MNSEDLSVVSIDSSVRAMTRDRAAGALYGVALGDAMGMPGELWSRPRIIAHFGAIDRFLAGPDGHFVVDGFVAGQVTDDTGQMEMLAESIVGADGRVEVRRLGRDLVAWADRVGASEGHFLGPTSARVITALRAGADPAATGVAGTTNGAAMRIAPVGVLCPVEDLPALVDEVEASCRIAHHTNIAVAGAAMIAAAISAAVGAPAAASPVQRTSLALAAALRAADIGMTRGQDAAGASLTARAELGIRYARETGTDDAFLQQVYDVVGASTETTESVPAALSIVARAAGDPRKAALLCANLGGDTDTIGAMAVGVVGAIAGRSGIPDELVETLESVNGFSFTALADRLADYRLARLEGIG
ncbi:ADP-ribosylglycohydrolase family protein [Microbacterium caowuchunii]|nr:ADP-ribosylglycohydrolase family protein [Microbacterium caowuchunii]